MKGSLKISLREDRMTVDVRFPDWDQGTKATSLFRALPPDGYKLVQAKIKQRASSGRACNAQWLFVHCDRRVEPFEEDEAYEFFRQELGQAQVRPDSPIARSWDPVDGNVFAGGGGEDQA